MFTLDLSRLLRYDMGLERFIQPPFVAHYRAGERDLYYVAAKHSCHIASATFRLVADCLRNLRVDLVLLETLSSNQSSQNPQMLQYLRQSGREEPKRCRGRGFYSGEVAYTAIKADERGIPFRGIEPPLGEIATALLADGYSALDILGYAFCMQIPPGRRVAAEFVRTFLEFERSFKPRLGLEGAEFTPVQFQNWYLTQTGNEFDFEQFDGKDIAPINGGSCVQAIGAQINYLRDCHHLETIADALTANPCVMVVCGASHLSCQKPVLYDMLGPPVRESRNL